MARKQEQEDARPEVTEVARGVLRMQLPIQMPGLGHVNMYALVDKDGAALVDPGLPGPATWRAIQDRLAQAQLGVKDVHTVIVTHSHPDHFGGASRFAEEAGAKVIAHRSFAFGVTAPEAQQPEVSVDDLDAQRTQLESDEEQPAPHVHYSYSPWRRFRTRTPWGGRGPRPPMRSMLKWMFMSRRGSFVPRISDPVDHGDILMLAGREWFVLHTPGHTTDHFCLHDPEEGVFLAGDHVLPSITPHISGISGAKDPLDSFFYSLDRVGEIQGVKDVLPAHGHPFDDLHERTAAIKRHHYERLEAVRSIAREIGPATVEDFSKRLFKERSWGPMAESETYAHLEHLRHAGEADHHRDRDGKLVYEL